MGKALDCVVVGGGPAGLAASAALTGRGVEHQVLERGRVGETWRTQRWDSFKLNTPGRMNRMLGSEAAAAYATGDAMVRLLEKLAAACPIRDGVGVSRMDPAGDGYVLRTASGDIHARTVVVATGDQNAPRVPAVAQALSTRVAQYHTADYRRPDVLPEGGVLVVGSAQSGCQIAADLIAGGRQVVLATSSAGRIPTPYRGRDMIDWLVDAGFFDQRRRDLPDPSMMRAPTPLIAPEGRSLGLPELVRAGVTLVGRPIAVDGERVGFDDSGPRNVAAGDDFAQRARDMADELIRHRGLEAPPAEPDEARGPVDLNHSAELDLRPAEISSVVWCTGFTGDFSWLPPGLTDANGRPRCQETAAPAPGVWYVGLRWLTRRGSSILYGFPGDAAIVADAVKANLGSRATG